MLTHEQRQRLAILANALIPPADGMPSASEAGVPGRWIDDALRYRPDLAEGLETALAVAGDLPADEAIELLNREHTAAFEALGTLIAGAYFLNPEIRRRIGYLGQMPTPPEEDLDTYFPLLEHVVARGRIYRDL